MTYTIKILIPRLDNSGPANGAKALEFWLSSSTDYSVSIHETKKGSVDFNGVDLVISMCLSADICALVSRHKYKLKWISTLRSNIFEDYRYLYGAKGIFVAALHNLLLLSADKVVCMYSDMNNKLLIPIRQKACVVCPNLISDRDKIVDIKCPPLKRLVVIGSLSRRKGIADLIEIFSVIKIYNLQLVFIGKGELKNFLEKKIKVTDSDKNIVLVGYVEEPYSLLQEGDYVLSNSESEGMSRALLDCVHGGVPVICKDLGQASDFIIEGKNGFKFRGIDELKVIIEELAKGIKSLNTITLPPEYNPKNVSKTWLGIVEKIIDDAA